MSFCYYLSTTRRRLQFSNSGKKAYDIIGLLIERIFDMKKLAMVLGLCVILLFTSFGCSGGGSNLDAEKATAQAVVHSAAVGLGGVLARYQDETERIQIIRDYIENVRFYPDQSGYFYVYDYNCVNIAHATQKNLVGQNLYNYQDSRGNYVIRLLSAAAQNGGGFVEYYWVNPNDISGAEQQKIGYVEPIPGTDYFIGTGVYTGQ
jgi:signal transduction histidine kinase